MDSQRRELVQPMPVWIPCLEEQRRVRRRVRRARAVWKLPEPKGRRLLRHVAKALTGLAARARAFVVVFGDAELRERRHRHLCGYVRGGVRELTCVCMSMICMDMGVCVYVYVYVYTHIRTDTYWHTHTQTHRQTDRLTHILKLRACCDRHLYNRRYRRPR